MEPVQIRASAPFPAFLQKRVNAYYKRIAKSRGGVHIFSGKAPDLNSILMISNDYLALANHPEITDAQINTLQNEGNGMMMSSVFVRKGDPQRIFEKKFAEYLGAEDCILCQSGYSANIGLLESIAGRSTPVYLDQLAHMSLWEGSRGVHAPVRLFRHNNVRHLEKKIQTHGSGIILVDSVYSVTGSVCPVAEISALAVKYDCVFVVDESHTLGTHGKQGAGLVVAEGLEKQIRFRTASLAKAFCGRAGIIVGTAKEIEFFRYNSSSLIFSSAVLHHDIAAFNAALEKIKTSDDKREGLREKARFLREQLTELGFNLNDSDSQILALEAGTELNLIALKKALEARDIFGSAFFPPATNKIRCMLRFSLNSSLSWEQIKQVVDACADIRSEVGVGSWPSTQRLKRKEDKISA